MKQKGNNKILKNNQIKKYLELLSILNQSTEDFLFLLDIEENVNWFFGDAKAKYNLGDPNKPTNTLEEMYQAVYENDIEKLSLDLEKVAKGLKKEHNMSYRWVTKDNKINWINCRGHVIDDENGRPMVMIGRVNDTVYSHYTNNITGIFNSNKLIEDLKNEIDEDEGYLLLVGIDNLGKINMKYGRELGDEYISYLANTIELINGIEYLYHLDSNVFGVYLSKSSESDVKYLFEKIQDSVKDKFNITGISVANVKGDFFIGEDLYQTAMEFIISAKKNKRCELTFYSKEEIEKKRILSEILQEMISNIRNNYDGFYLVYQPQINSNRYSLYGVEALLRYKSKKYGEIYPDQFIPILEQTNLIKDVGYWVLREALKQIKIWRQYIPNLHLNLNFSLVQLDDDDVTNEVARIFVNSKLPPNSVTIEITETVKVEEIRKFNRTFKVWKSLGIELAIDDFGTGYSNLGMLKKFDFDEIKVDRMFITGIKVDTYDYILISNIIEFAKANSIRVCCEGIESENELKVLSKLNPDYYQGYLFSKPCKAEEFEECYINKDSELYQDKLNKLSRLNQKKLESMIQFNFKDVLEAVDVGLWIIRVDPNTKVFELHTNEIVDNALEINKNVTPKECYDYWISRIDKEYINYVNDAFEKIISTTDKVIIVRYPWNHPTKGEMYLSWSGIRTEDEDGYILIKGLHRILSDTEEAKYLEKNQTVKQYLVQNRQRYIDVILANSIGFLEADLTENIIKGSIVASYNKTKAIPIDEKIIRNENNELVYSDFEKWWAERYIISNKEEFIQKTSIENIISCYKEGQNPIDVFCTMDIDGLVFDCKESFFVYEDEFSGHLCVFSIVYDLTEENRRKREEKHKNMIIQKLSDEYNAICYVDLDTGLMDDYRFDEIWNSWDHHQKLLFNYQDRVVEFAKDSVYEADIDKFINNLSIDNLKDKLKEEPVYTFEYRVLKDGIPNHYLAKVVLDESIFSGTCVIIGFKDIEKEKVMQYRLEKALELSHTDKVTGLLNQQGLLEKATNLLSEEDKNSAIFFMDIDDFKAINDTYGHAVGDEILNAVGKVLKDNTRKTDLVGRYGGDEFIALIHDVPSKEVAINIAWKICEKVKEIKYKDNQNIITVSIGVSYTGESGYNYRLLKDIADDRLYIAKRSGKDKVISE